MSAATMTSPRPRFAELPGSHELDGLLVAPCPACRRGTASLDSMDLIDCDRGCTHALICKELFAPPPVTSVTPAPAMLRAADVVPRVIEWLWFPFIPLGKLTLIAGKPGQGKSLSTAWLASAVTRGEGIDTSPGSALVLSAEDDPEDTVRPRLEAAGADLERVWIAPNATLDVDQLEQLTEQAGDLKLVTIDPVSAFLPSSVNAWKSQDVRGYLEPLRVFAAKRRVAVVLIQHLNRRSDASDALDRIADSAGLPQLCRSVLVWGPDPADPEGDNGTRKILARSKANLAKASASASFTIAEVNVSHGIKAPALTRGEDRRVDADDVIVSVETRTAQDEAVEWLRSLLSGGALSAKEVRRRAREDGIADRTLDRAKRAAGVESKPDRSEAGITSWQWQIATPTTSYRTGDVGDVGDLGDVGSSPRTPRAPSSPTQNGGGEVISLPFRPNPSLINGDLDGGGA
jgi:putative DNA primase/helicase